MIIDDITPENKNEYLFEIRAIFSYLDRSNFFIVFLIRLLIIIELSFVGFSLSCRKRRILVR